jgi:hypothetical protein
LALRCFFDRPANFFLHFPICPPRLAAELMAVESAPTTGAAVAVTIVTPAARTTRKAARTRPRILSLFHAFPLFTDCRTPDRSMFFCELPVSVAN